MKPTLILLGDVLLFFNIISIKYKTDADYIYASIFRLGGTILNYKLRDYIALRGWYGAPLNYINYNNGLIYSLNKSEFEILKKCDGQIDISETNELKKLLEENIIEPCYKKNNISDWQRYKFCANNCFTTAYWSITDRCNYNCKHCFMSPDESKLSTEFTWDECKQFIESCDKCGIYNIIITGGEPFLHPHFFDIIHECNKKNIKIKEILTNASLIDLTVIQKLSQLKTDSLIKISFDGLRYHDWMRGVPGAEQKTLNTIKLLKNNGFRVCVQMCIHKENISTIYPTVELLDSIGVDKIRILRTCESPRWDKYKNLMLSVQEYFDLALNFIDNYINKNHTMSVEFFKFVFVSPKHKTYKCMPIKNSGTQYDKIPACSEMRFCINVSGSGDIVPCSRLTGYYKKYGIHFGNIKKDDMQQILLDSEYFNCASKTVNNILESNDTCKKCKFISKCYTGCRAAALVFSNNINGPDLSDCIYFNNYYYQKTKEIMSRYNYTENL